MGLMLSGDIPIGETKVRLLKSSSVASTAASTVGYGDHPTDVPFLEACDRGVLVHELDAAQAGTLARAVVVAQGGTARDEVAVTVHNSRAMKQRCEWWAKGRAAGPVSRKNRSRQHART